MYLTAMNAETRVSAKGQIVIPKEVRDAKRWHPGTALEVIDRPDGVLLRPVSRKGARPIREVLREVRAIVNYQGPYYSEADWDQALDERFRAEP